jgi:hypothetical protein
MAAAEDSRRHLRHAFRDGDAALLSGTGVRSSPALFICLSAFVDLLLQTVDFFAGGWPHHRLAELETVHEPSGMLQLLYSSPLCESLLGETERAYLGIWRVQSWHDPRVCRALC